MVAQVIKASDYMKYEIANELGFESVVSNKKSDGIGTNYQNRLVGMQDRHTEYKNYLKK